MFAGFHTHARGRKLQYFDNRKRPENVGDTTVNEPTFSYSEMRADGVGHPKGNSLGDWVLRVRIPPFAFPLGVKLWLYGMTLG